MKQMVVPLASIALLAGCSNYVPKCGDLETTDLVKQIANEEMTRQVGSESANLFSYSVNSIRTTDEHDVTGAFDCAAQLEVRASNTGDSNELAITYTVEATDDGEEFYVEVYGL